MKKIIFWIILFLSFGYQVFALSEIKTFTTDTNPNYFVQMTGTGGFYYKDDYTHPYRVYDEFGTEVYNSNSIAFDHINLNPKITKEVVLQSGTRLVFTMANQLDSSYSNAKRGAFVDVMIIRNDGTIEYQNLLSYISTSSEPWFTGISAYQYLGNFFITYNYKGIYYKKVYDESTTGLFIDYGGVLNNWILFWDLLTVDDSTDYRQASGKYWQKIYARADNIILYSDLTELKIRAFSIINDVMITSDSIYFTGFSYDIYNFSYYTANEGDNVYISFLTKDVDSTEVFYAYKQITGEDTAFDWNVWYAWLFGLQLYRVANLVALESYNIFKNPITSIIYDGTAELNYTFGSWTTLYYSDTVDTVGKIHLINEDDPIDPVDPWTWTGTIDYDDSIFNFDIDGDGEVWLLNWEIFIWIWNTIKYFFVKLMSFFSNIKELIEKLGESFTSEEKTFSFISTTYATQDISSIINDNVNEAEYKETVLGKLDLFIKWFIAFFILVIGIAFFIWVNRRKND